MGWIASVAFFWVITGDRHFPDGVNDGLELFDFFLSFFFASVFFSTLYL